MTIPLARPVRKLKQAISRRLPQRRDDSGLTTLEWLLIVAAVAGLAALAVVLVQNVVGETSEQIAGSSARKTAAQIAASEIMAAADRDPLPFSRTAPIPGAEWLTTYDREMQSGSGLRTGMRDIEGGAYGQISGNHRRQRLRRG